MILILALSPASALLTIKIYILTFFFSIEKYILYYMQYIFLTVHAYIFIFKKKLIFSYLYIYNDIW